MTLHYLMPDPLDGEIAALLDRLAAGEAPRDLETRRVDVKEEAGRRIAGGAVGAGRTQNPAAAEALAPEVACMANTPGAAALVLGIADDGQRIGTALDPEWLRHELYRLSDRQLTVDIRAALHEGVRLLVLRVPEALEPIRWRNRILWRVDDNCVEVDSASWWEGRLHRLGHDWSAQPSEHTVGEARPAALERARQFLRDSNEGPALDLADASDADLLRRLNAVVDGGRLTQGGALLFVGRDTSAIDYIRRDASGGDSVIRLRRPGLGLLEELYDVEQAIAAANPAVHLATGLSVGQLRQLPRLAVREAIVNGVVHRDWRSPAVTTVEHTGATLVVSSPGGFVGGVTPENIITHPSEPRYRSLAEIMSSLRVAEREGIGVDRMIREMIRVGYPAPQIEELEGPRVRAALVGGRVDEPWLRFLSGLAPSTTGNDLDALLVLRHLLAHAWIDAERAAPVLQRHPVEANAVLDRLALATTAKDARVIVPVAGTPEGELPAWRLSNPVRALFASRLAPVTGPASRGRLAAGWARSRGRVSTTELGDIAGIAVNAAGGVLHTLENDGLLRPSRGNRAGRSFHYLPIDDPHRLR